jgi:hypothetical protein
MTNTEFGFVSFEKCFHCNGIRTYFTVDQSLHLGEEYREGPHFWSLVEIAQSFRFDLKCTACNYIEDFREFMGLLFCTDCIPGCDVSVLQKKYALAKTWVLVAFGHLPQAMESPISTEKLGILTHYFNQRRDTARSKVKFLPFNLIEDLTCCRGEFIHDVGMLSQEPPEERKPLF